jgi:3-methyladenine DNA glycosylase/8-oxoguanine DNA glycosylase
VAGTLELRLAGPSGEPVDLWRTLVSHGVGSLPPAHLDEDARTLEITVPVARSRPRTVVVAEGRPGTARIEVYGPRLSQAGERALTASLRRVLNLDEDLAPFYRVASTDPHLAWAAEGAGRMLRSATVFEDVVKTICTTNTVWSATVKMVTALVDDLGEPSAGNRGRAFPTPESMAAAPESFYRDVVRAGYRGAYLRALAAGVADGSTDLEALLDREIEDGEVRRRLLALPGVGPYAAAHVMMLIGRHSHLILDSWTRPKYARLNGRKNVTDQAILRRFKRYGPYAGLAFWLVLTRDWVAEQPLAP